MTLTNLIPTLVEGFDVVSRELVGFLPSVNRDPRADRIAKNQTLYSWLSPVATLSNITAAAATPTAAATAFGNVPITITNFKMTDFVLTGEESLGLGSNTAPMVADLVEQGIRAIVNQMESDVYTAAYVASSRACGTAGTTPFGAGLLTSNVGTVGDTAQIKKILDDNGAPPGTRSLILDTTAGAALRTLSNLTKVNESGSTMTLRDGVLLDLNGLMIKESAQITAPAAGTMASATTTSAAFTVGQTVLPLATAGTGVVAAGDVITIVTQTYAGPGGTVSHKYVVTSVSFAGANPASGDTITIAAPGLRVAASAATRAITVLAAGTRNLGFSRNSILFASRLPALPDGGDIARDRMTITDARSNITIEIAEYPQYRQLRYELSAAWSATVLKPEHIATLLG